MVGPNNVKLGLTTLVREGRRHDCSVNSLLKDVTTRVNHRLASPIVLLTILPTVAFARAAARRDIEEYFVLETRKL